MGSPAVPQHHEESLREDLGPKGEAQIGGGAGWQWGRFRAADLYSDINV